MIVDETISDMDVSIKKSVSIDGDKLVNPVFTFEGTGKKTLHLSNKITIGAQINAEESNNSFELSGSTLRSSIYEGGDGKDKVRVFAGSELLGGSKINLGENMDVFTLDGIVKRSIVDNGRDSAKDKIVIKNVENIVHCLDIRNFGKEDLLVLEGQKIRREMLSNIDERIKLESHGIFIDFYGGVLDPSIDTLNVVCC